MDFPKKSHFCYIFGIFAEVDDIDIPNQFYQRKIDQPPASSISRALLRVFPNMGTGKIYNIVLIARTTSDPVKFVRNRLTILFSTETDGLTTKTSGKKRK